MPILQIFTQFLLLPRRFLGVSAIHELAYSAVETMHTAAKNTNPHFDVLYGQIVGAIIFHVHNQLVDLLPGRV